MKKTLGKTILKSLILAMLYCNVLVPTNAWAVPGSGKAVREGFEFLVKKIMRESAEEGGERITRETAERLTRKYGDDALSMLKKFRTRGLRHVDNYGDDAIQILKRYGDEGSEAMTKYGDDLISAARKYGVDNATEVVLKHDRLGLQALKTFGDDAVTISKKLDTQEMITVLRYAKQIDDPTVVRKLGTLVKDNGGRALKAIGRFVAKNPKKTAFTGAVIYFYNNPEQLQKITGAVSKTITEWLMSLFKGIPAGINNALGVDDNSFLGTIIKWVITIVLVLAIPATLYFVLRPWIKSITWLWRPVAKVYRKMRPKKTDSDNTTDQTTSHPPVEESPVDAMNSQGTQTATDPEEVSTTEDKEQS